MELSKEHPEGVVKFVYHYIDKNRFDLVFDKELPNGTRVFAIDKRTGQKVELDQTLYEPKTFEKILVNGDYQIHIDLPKGYRAVENDFFYTVGERINRYLTSFVEVSDDQVEDPIVPSSPIPSPQPSTTTQEGEIGKQPDGNETHPIVAKQTDIRPMFQKVIGSEIGQSTKEEASQSSPSLPKTGQGNEQTGMVGLLVLLLTFGAIRLKKNRPDQG